jgi:DNA-binding YbaB/EbfC family protein
MKADLGQLMRQAQKAQEAMQRLQAELAQAEATGEAGGGMVKITLNGKHEARRVEIAAEAMQESKDFIEDLVAAAINDAAHKLERNASEKMAKLTSGLQLPPGMNFGA